MRVVIDTNLLVSYLIAHRPPLAEIIDVYLARGDFTLLTAPVLLEELDRVLQYPRLHRYYDAETRVRFVALVAALSEVVDLPDEILHISRDRDLLDLTSVGDIPILSARQFLDRLRGR
jgi:putative PIN family toxin of toxin-antitoxin system